MFVLSSCEAIIECMAVYYCSPPHNRSFFAPWCFWKWTFITHKRAYITSAKVSVLVFLSLSHGFGGFKIQDNSNLVRNKLYPQSSRVFYREVSGYIQVNATSIYIARTGVSRVPFDSSRNSSSSSLFISSALFKIHGIALKTIEPHNLELTPRSLELKSLSLGVYFFSHLLSAISNPWQLKLHSSFPLRVRDGGVQL